VIHPLIANKYICVLTVFFCHFVIFETSVTIYQSVIKNNSEDLNVQMCQPQIQRGRFSVK